VSRVRDPAAARAVRLAIGDALGLWEDEIRLAASLRDDLGAFSADLQAIAAGVRRHAGVEIGVGDMPLGSVTVSNLVQLVSGLLRERPGSGSNPLVLPGSLRPQ